MIHPIQNLTTTVQQRFVDRSDMIATARAFEAMIVSQMLQAAGMDKPLDSFGGGTGEAQFASFLTDAHAQALAARGGIGLAEQLIRALGESGQAS